MVTVDIDEAKKQLSRLVDRAAEGESFVIARGGKPLVKVFAFDASILAQRFGFLVGEIIVPDDFDRMAEREIEGIFGPAPSAPS
jgi:antitoxin (DNA-binding transcriptional repressor) of toxin-antitoxin stability system